MRQYFHLRAALMETGRAADLQVQRVALGAISGTQWNKGLEGVTVDRRYAAWWQICSSFRAMCISAKKE